MVMEIGVRVPCYRQWCRRAEVEAIATQAEETGFASLWVQDHLVAPTGSREATDRQGPQRLDVRRPRPRRRRASAKTIAEYYAGDDWWIDPYAMWGFLAGVTKRVRLGSDILVIPYRHPVVQAKLIGSLDVLSDGRMIIGTGSGHVPAEAGRARRRLRRQGAAARRVPADHRRHAVRRRRCPSRASSTASGRCAR